MLSETIIAKDEAGNVLGERTVQVPTTLDEALELWGEDGFLAHAIRAYAVKVQHDIRTEARRDGKPATGRGLVAKALAAARKG